MSGPGGGANGRTSWAPYAEQREPKAVHKRPGLPEKSQSGGGTSDNIQLSEPTREAGALRQSLPARWTRTPRTRSVRSGLATGMAPATVNTALLGKWYGPA